MQDLIHGLAVDAGCAGFEDVRHGLLCLDQPAQSAVEVCGCEGEGIASVDAADHREFV